MSERKNNHGTNSLTFDTLFDILNHHRRQAILTVLINNSRTLTVNDLTKEIAVQEHEKPITDIAGDNINRIYLSLHHNHIPKLAESPLIEHDHKREMVKPTETLEQIESFLLPVLEADSVNQLINEE